MNRHLPPTTVTPVDWFRRMPNGGATFFVDQVARRGGPAAPSTPVGHRPITPVTPVDWFRRMPNGGGTFFVDQARSRGGVK